MSLTERASRLLLASHVSHVTCHVPRAPRLTRATCPLRVTRYMPWATSCGPHVLRLSRYSCSVLCLTPHTTLHVKLPWLQSCVLPHTPRCCGVSPASHATCHAIAASVLCHTVGVSCNAMCHAVAAPVQCLTPNLTLLWHQSCLSGQTSQAILASHDTRPAFAASVLRLTPHAMLSWHQSCVSRHMSLGCGVCPVSHASHHTVAASVLHLLPHVTVSCFIMPQVVAASVLHLIPHISLSRRQACVSHHTSGCGFVSPASRATCRDVAVCFRKESCIIKSRYRAIG